MHYKSYLKYLKEQDGAERKMLFENPDILFANKCLLVEGYTDYIFMRAFLKVFDITDFHIVITRGCGSKLYEIMNKLKIKYKII